jgi:perosamine synthetase
MNKKINYAGPWITNAEIEAVIEAVKNGFYENYKKDTQSLEDKVKSITGAKYALATSSCTSSLHLACAALQLGDNDEVITTDSSCVASALPILYTGAKAVFVDVDETTWNISPKQIENAITEKTKAILVVHWNGNPAEIDKICSIAKNNNLAVIEDCAPALGASFNGTKVGTFGDIGCFSFQGAKVAIGGQGGILVTNSSDLYNRAKILGSYGRTDSKMQYWSDYIGWNYGMPNLPAALARAQLERLDELIAKKRKIFEWYSENLNSLSEVSLIKECEGAYSTYCYPALDIKSKKIQRSNLINFLAQFGIDSRPAQPRISKMPMFSQRYENEVCQNIEDYGLILPSAFNLEEEDINFVCQKIIQYFKDVK